MKELNYVDSNGNNINISVIGCFSIPDLKKEYIMYSLIDDNINNENAYVMLGEIVRENEKIKILGILPEEKDLVVAYYNEISNQLGGENNG